MIDTGVKDPEGKPILVACAVCHTKPATPGIRVSADLQFFHQSLKCNHGNLTCISCHNPADGYATLRLADGKALAYAEVMTLCAQCHTKQHRDYMHGSHGGMTGYWDLSRGPRTRKHCVDCHDVHLPKFAKVSPVPAPRDRFAPAFPQDQE